MQEQIVEWLELPDLYDELPRVLSVADFEGGGILVNAKLLQDLLESWVKPINSETELDA
jgi:hypothetical protein